MTAEVIVFAPIDLTEPNAPAIHAAELADQWVALGYSTTLVVPRPRGSQALEVSPRAAKLFLSGSPGPFPFAVVTLRQIPFALRHALRPGRRIFYSRMGPLSFLLIAVLKPFKRHFVISEHNGLLRTESLALGQGRIRASFKNIAQQFDARLADSVRVVVEDLGRFLLRGPHGKKIFVMGNGTNTNSFRPIDRSAALSEFGLPEGTYVGFLGSLNAWQGLDTAIRAFAKVVKDLPDASLLIGGDGPDLNHLENLVTKLGLQGNVKFFGGINPTRANAFLNCFDLGIAPFTLRRNEAIGLSPLKIRDYAAAGRPVLAASVKGIRELAEHGWLDTHEPDNPDDLAEKIRGALLNKRRLEQMGSKGRSYALANFRWARIAEQLLEQLPIDFRLSGP